MKAPIAICTWNRAALLAQTLERMCLLNVEGISWELLIVNNNCTDETDTVIERFAGRLPIRRLAEPRPGQCHARNCALRAAAGELIVWTDDDVLVDPGWLQAYVRAASEFPASDFFGGPIEPWYESPPPRWVRDNIDMLLGAFVILNLARPTGPFPAGLTPYGANMAFRTLALRAYAFDTRLGYTAGALVGGDETSLIHRMRKEGHAGTWVAQAAVRHYIPAERMSPPFLWRWWEGFGKSLVILESPPVGTRWFGVSRWALRQYVQHRALAAAWGPFSARRWLRHYTAAARAYGTMRSL
jgi:glycosyltransferase involved in cell wall biosynthesis